MKRINKEKTDVHFLFKETNNLEYIKKGIESI